MSDMHHALPLLPVHMACATCLRTRCKCAAHMATQSQCHLDTESWACNAGIVAGLGSPATISSSHDPTHVPVLLQQHHADASHLMLQVFNQCRLRLCCSPPRQWDLTLQPSDASGTTSITAACASGNRGSRRHNLCVTCIAATTARQVPCRFSSAGMKC